MYCLYNDAEGTQEEVFRECSRKRLLFLKGFNCMAENFSGMGSVPILQRVYMVNLCRPITELKLGRSNKSEIRKYFARVGERILL